MNNQYEKFKHLLEYFVAHLEYCVSGDKSTNSYTKYIKPIPIGDFKKSGRGYDGHGIQKQVKDWESYNNGAICINIRSSQDYKNRGCYLNWKDTAISVNAVWEKDSITKLQIVKNSHPLRNAEVVLTCSTTELGIFDNNTPNDKLKSFFDKFDLLYKV